MKGLLHSKKFRANLYKWLFMYVGVMGLLTTVITYSKYISSLGGNDETRGTKFEMKLTPEGCVSEVCLLGNYRPMNEIEYDFDVDEEFEVKTYVILSFLPKDKFKIKSISSSEYIDGVADEDKFIPIYINDEDEIKIGNGYVDAKKDVSNTAAIQLGKEIDPTKKKYKFRVVVEYDYSEYLVNKGTDNEFYDYSGSEEITLDKTVVQLSYSAVQITN